MKLKCARDRIGSAKALLWLAVLAILSVTPAAAAILQATVTGGTVAGTVDAEHGIASFKGIPFAAPPVGGLRWKPPQSVVAWQGIKKADAFADSCPQEHEKSIRGSEDCLYLNVATKSPPWYWWVVVDGNVLPGTSFDLYQHGSFTDTPILIGYNSDDRHEDPPSHGTVAWFEDYVSHVHNQCPSMLKAILAAYPHRTDAEATQAYRDLFLDTWYGGNTWTWARMHNHYGRTSTYVYYFDIHPPGKPGAFHADELPYVFGNFDSTPSAEAVATSTLIRRYWINFATHGDPNGPGLPPWPKFTEKAQNAMIFDRSPSERPLPHTDRMKTLEQYYACVRSNM